MKQLPKSLLQKLREREEANALRTLPVPESIIDFSSNDYLGFSQNRDIFKQAHQYLLDSNVISNGSTGSRLITGNHSLYRETEEFIARFHNSAAALIFNSGYDANVGLFSSVPQKEDVVLYDEYIHASIRDGLRLSNAKTFKFRHNDISHIESLISRHRGEGELYIITESVFSMDGDNPDIKAFINIAEKHHCRLIVDEAHALGVFGTNGEGLVQNLGLEDKIFARIVTFGKGLGCHGAAVLCSQQLYAYLINFARSFIYTTALPPHSLSVILTAYKYLANKSLQTEQLKNIVSFFTDETKRLGIDKAFIYSTSAIHCAVVSGNRNVKNISSVLRQNGFNVKAILSPTVPQGSERLRFCLHSYTTREQVTAVLTLLKQFLQQGE